MSSQAAISREARLMFELGLQTGMNFFEVEETDLQATLPLLQEIRAAGQPQRLVLSDSPPRRRLCGSELFRWAFKQNCVA